MHAIAVCIWNVKAVKCHFLIFPYLISIMLPFFSQSPAVMAVAQHPKEVSDIIWTLSTWSVWFCCVLITLCYTTRACFINSDLLTGVGIRMWINKCMHEYGNLFVTWHQRSITQTCVGIRTMINYHIPWKMTGRINNQCLNSNWSILVKRDHSA